MLADIKYIMSLTQYCNLEKWLLILTNIFLGLVFLALKLTQICYINTDISFLENWQLKHKLLPLSNTLTKLERLSSQSDKMWKYAEFRKANIRTHL